MFIKKFITFLFTWWNGNTVGTSLYTLLYGIKIGEDYLGNSYYESKDKKNRWCIYHDQSEASRISPEWNNWLRFVSNAALTDNNKMFYWQKKFSGNDSGLQNAYRPSMIKSVSQKESLESYEYDYKAWNPESNKG